MKRLVLCALMCLLLGSVIGSVGCNETKTGSQEQTPPSGSEKGGGGGVGMEAQGH